MWSFDVPTATAPISINVEPGSSVVLLGANGGGKTRLGVMLEQSLGASSEVHRIGAHRSLTMNTKVQPPSYDVAERRLLYGYDQGAHGHRTGHRWQSKPAVILLSDFDHVLAALYADENRTSVLHRQAHLVHANAKPPTTKLDRLKTIWHSLLPHRQLAVLDGDVQVKPIGMSANQYDAGEMSDGERVIFYLIGQVLLTRAGTLIIVDEPELHVNRSILPKLWDAIEGARKDCAFIYLTHDLEFASSRRAATKFAVNAYAKLGDKEQWEIEPIPSDTGIQEDIVTKIIGSRFPVLFIEGDGGSLDSAIYRRVYDGFTTIPVGNCESVIHSVASFTKHAAFHRLRCAGLVDADGRDTDEAARLVAINVYVLPVSEVENILLLPKPFMALAKLLKFDDVEAQKKLEKLKVHVMKEAKADADRFVLDATRRRIDSAMKKIGLSAKSIADLATEFTAKTAQIDPAAIHADIRNEFDAAVANSDYKKILHIYDNKGLLAEVTRLLGVKGRKELEEFIGRALRDESSSELLTALKNEVPVITL